MPNPTLNIPQARFLALDAKFKAFVAGFGSGKTWVGCGGLMKHHWEFPKVNSGYLAPNYSLIESTFYPTIEEVAYNWGLRLRIVPSNKEVHVFEGSRSRGTIICRSMDKPETIVGFNIGHALCDELDILKKEKARQVWNKTIARMRSNVDGLRNGIDVTTTPEGFKFVHDQFVKALRKKPSLAGMYGLVQASTYDNEKNLPHDYIQSLLDTYPQALILAYLDGKFVNLTSGTVYSSFDRLRNHSDLTVNDARTLHIGMDFNVMNMSAIVHIIKNGDPVAVKEHLGIRDTPAMVELLQAEYPDKQMIIYPDASGQNTSSKSASVSDLSILTDAGFSLEVENSNPFIKDRVNAMNAMFCNAAGVRRYLVNIEQCPLYTESLEQQSYDDGVPDKSAGFDHACFSGDTLVTTRSGVYRFDEMPESGYVMDGLGGWVNYQKAGITGANRVTIYVKFENGFSVVCTEDHKFLTVDGEWVCAKNLKGKKCLLSLIPSSYSMGNDSIVVDSTLRTVAEKKIVDYIALCGFIIMEKYQKILIFIMSIMMYLTTRLKTLLVCLVETILASMHKVLNKKIECQHWVNYISRKRKSGMHQKKVNKGIGSIIKKQNIRLEPKLNESAIFVENVSKVQFPQKNVSEYSAQKLAYPHIGEHQGLMMSRRLASFVAQNSYQTNTKNFLYVVSIEEMEVENHVYCLKTSSGFFKLNKDSPIVSNCDAGGYFIANRYPIIKPEWAEERVLRL